MKNIIDEIVKEAGNRFGGKGIVEGTVHKSYPFLDHTSLKEDFISYLRTSLEKVAKATREEDVAAVEKIMNVVIDWYKGNNTMSSVALRNMKNEIVSSLKNLNLP